MRFIVFDTEATDLIPGQICQLAYLKVEEETITGHNFFFSVDEMSVGSQDVHGLSIEMLKELSNGRWFEDEALSILQDFNDSGLLIGHNVAADERYLRVEMERAGFKLNKVKTFCTMNFASGIMNMQRRVVTGRPKPPKLSELADYYSVTETQTANRTEEWFGAGGALHDARFDTTMTWLCVVKAIEKGDLRGLLQ